MKTITDRAVAWYLGKRRIRVEIQLERIRRYHA